MTNKPLFLRANTHGRGAPSLPDRGPAWMTDPARGCAPSKVKSDLFFSENRADQNVAVQVCLTSCPFVSACDAYATEQGEREGVWGGKVRSSRQHRNTTPQPDDTVVVDQALTSRPELFKRLTGEQQADVVRAGLERGMSLNKMAQRFHKTITGLKLLIGEEVASFDQQVNRLYHNGRTDIEIATVLGTHPKTVGVSRARQQLPALYGPGGRKKWKQRGMASA
jgi:hypothetical protein